MSNAQMAAPTLPISCFIIAKNEADRIAATIRSVSGLVDDIVVVDSGSTDGTQAIAQGLGARVMFNAWPGFGQQKRFAEAQCQHNWILNLDADEIVIPKLAAEIRAHFETITPAVAGFWVNDLVVYPGRDRPRLFARDHQFIRLYDRRRIRFKDSTLFDSVDAKGQPTAWLRAPLHHYSVRSFNDLIAKCDERAAYNAGNAKTKNRALLALRLLIEYPTQFLKYYLWRTHVFGGIDGLQFARIVAFYRYVRILRMWEGAASNPAILNTRRAGAQRNGATASPSDDHTPPSKTP
jgi:glycosyltransferase involved in cell wall biosynthesis